MPSAIRSERLLAANNFSGWRYATVPAGVRWSLKYVAAYNQAGGSLTAAISVAGYVFVQKTLAFNDTWLWEGTVVLYAGEQVGAYSSAVGITVVMSGFALPA